MLSTFTNPATKILHQEKTRFSLNNKWFAQQHWIKIPGFSKPVVLKLWYARAFQVVREQLSCHIRKASLIRFCVIIRSCVTVMLLIRLFAILILSSFEQITFFWNQGCTLQHSKSIRWYAISKSLRTTVLSDVNREQHDPCDYRYPLLLFK